MSFSVTVGELGENEALKRTVARLNQGDYTVVGSGDDAAVIKAADGRFVVTTDTMIEGHDFRLDWSTGFDLGFKAVATNISDVAAMGAKPTSLVVAISVPSTTQISFLESFADGLRTACEQLAPGCAVVGGDLAASDAIAAYDALVGVQLRPEPPIAAGIGVYATSMLDVSDGLARDAARIAKASSVAIRLKSQDLQGFEAMLDDVALRLGVSSRDWVLFGGEDHSLLATFASETQIPRAFKPIGIVSEGFGVWLDDLELPEFGWDSVRG